MCHGGAYLRKSIKRSPVYVKNLIDHLILPQRKISAEKLHDLSSPFNHFTAFIQNRCGGTACQKLLIMMELVKILIQRISILTHQ